MMSTHHRLALLSNATMLFLFAVVWAPQPVRAPLTASQEIAVCQRRHAQTDLYGFDMRGQRKSVYVDLEVFRRSVHRQLLRTGKNGTSSASGKPPAVCTDCRGVHGIRRASDPNSSVARAHLPETCGNCHESIYREWEESIHGQAAVPGIKAASVCADCHGEHTIRGAQDPASSVYPQHIVATCSKCHEDQRLQRAIGSSLDCSGGQPRNELLLQ